MDPSRSVSLNSSVDELLSENRYQHIQSGSVSVPKAKANEPWFSFKTLWAYSGPGLLMSMAYLDPGNIESDVQAGAVAGYNLLSIVFWSTIIGLVFQILAARLGVTNGRHLAQVCRAAYGVPTKITLWIMMEIAIIASDVQEVIGSAIAIRILSNGAVPLWAGSLITAVDTFTFLFLESYGLRKLEALFGVLISTMCITFGYMYVIGAPDQVSVVKGIADIRIGDAMNQAVAVVGAVIMPHNLYLHSALTTSRRVNRMEDKQVQQANKYNAIESTIVLVGCFIINVFVVAVFAKGFYGTPNASDVDLLSSGEYLGQQFGNAVKYIWAIGLLAAGQSSTMTGTYAGQFVMEGFLRLSIAPWKRVALTRSLAMIPTVAVAVFANEHILNGVFEWMNVLQSFQLPFAIFPLVHFVSLYGVMGKYCLRGWLKIFVWLLCLLLVTVNMYLLVITLENFTTEWYYDLIISLICVPYFAFTLYIIIGPFLPVGGMSHFARLQLPPVNAYLHDDLDATVMDIEDIAPLIT
eukprot:m.24533 g.24533  ORF g.24533 m.24533 type:complete len:522 (+) comp9701_c0_seq1:395-1960(+)